MIRVLARFEFHLLLFFIALAFFLKPVLLPRPEQSAASMLLAFFLPWAALIALLFLIARVGPAPDEDEQPPADS